jgi:glycosyltransferase involved in cell wall biosynthesis
VLLSIHHALDAGAGAPAATLAIGRALEAQGHEVSFWSWEDLPRRLGPRAKELLFPEFAVLGMRAAARDRVDVIDASTGDAWLWHRLSRPGGRAGAPLLVTRSHGLEHAYRRAAGSGRHPYHDGVRLREVAASLRAADLVLLLNSADREEAVQELRVPAARAHVVPNGVDDALLGLPAPAPAGEASLRVAVIGTWDRRKGSDVALAALRAAPEVQATFLGTGPAPPRLDDRFGVVERFERRELPGLLADHHVLLQPSRAEGFSLALVEGMACGLAPIATRVGAAPDVVDDERTGLLTAPEDVGGLASALRRLARDRPLLDALRAGAHAAAQRYSWTRIARETAQLYATALGDRPR